MTTENLTSHTTSEQLQEELFLYDSEQLHAITSAIVIKQGLEYFKENRVTDMAWDKSRLWADVEDTEDEEPYAVELIRKEGLLHVSCPCRNAPEKVCKHAVALLYNYAAELPGSNGEVNNALESAIDERIKRGRSEVKVELLSGKLWFGSWRAASIASATHRPQNYTVHIRSLSERSNYCTCPDLATNQLGTCKHIEAVLHRIKKEPDYDKIAQQSPPQPFVYLAWNVIDAPQIKLQRVAGQGAEQSELLDHHFDRAGLFKGLLPDAFFHFSDNIYGHDDIHIGEDVQRHLRRLAADASHTVRAQQIRDQISSSGGALPGIRARLYPYQMEGVAFLAATGRALLADDMGLGKTLQAIAAASWLERNADVSTVLVICPASLKQQWAREITKFTDHKVQIIQGGPEARQAQYRKGHPFCIVNYELVLRDLTVINQTLRPDLLILDEAQRIKNWRTKIASTIKLIPSRYAFVLTGTPLENRLEDLYSLLQVIDPHVLGPLWRYLLDFHVTDERGKVLGYRNLSELRRRIAPVMLRRDRSLVRDQLPDRTEIRLDVAMTEAQQELHDSALTTAGRLANIAKRRPLTPSEQNRMMAALQQARMACNAAGLVDKESIGSPKLDEVATLLEELCLQDGLKVVVFSQWERMTLMVEQLAKKLRIGSVRLHGGVPTAKRGDLMDRFLEDDATQIFISTDAGGVGLNLQSGSVLINLDIPWNPAILDQRIARIHRLGQKKKVQIILIIAADSYEERVLQLVQGKRDLFDNVVDPLAEQDVVGVSKRMLETVIEDLNEEETAKKIGADSEEETPEAVAAETNERASAKSISKQEESEEDIAVRHTIEAVQKCWGHRIERILGTGGGLLVVMEPFDDEDAERANDLSLHGVGVALIDPRTLIGLQRLGAASPIAGATLLVDVEGQQPQISPLQIQAEEKLKAAELLIEQRCFTSAVELLASAMLLAAAARADLKRAPRREEAAVWIYSQALPQGLLVPDQANALLRALTLIDAPELPESLLEEVISDARGLVSVNS